jgi:hypothetical protein
MKKIELGEKIEVGWNYYLKYIAFVLMEFHATHFLAIC